MIHNLSVLRYIIHEHQLNSKRLRKCRSKCRSKVAIQLCNANALSYASCSTALIQDINTLCNRAFDQQLRGTLQHPFLLSFFRPNALRECVKSVPDGGFWLLWEPISIISNSARFHAVNLVDLLLLQDFEQA